MIDKINIAHTPSGWSRSEVMVELLNYIQLVSNRMPCALILDHHAPHETEVVVKKAESLRIKLIFVPKGMTWCLQPLDVGVMGPFKAKLTKIWTDTYRHLNNDGKNYYENWTKAVVEAWDKNVFVLLLRRH